MVGYAFNQVGSGTSFVELGRKSLISIGNLVGKIWILPNTVLGDSYGVVGYVVGL